MKNIAFFFLACGVLFVNVLVAQPTMLWDKTYGGNGWDNLSVVVAIPGGGFLLGGTSGSDIGFEKSENRRGNVYEPDYWIIRVDDQGNKLWDKTFGGEYGDYLNVAVVTLDGGFLLGGSSASLPGFDKTASRYAEDNYWLVRLDASGNKLWDKSYASYGSINSMNSLIAMPDGGFILGGESNGGEGGDKSEPRRCSCFGATDYWMVRIDPMGNKLWDRTLGAENLDKPTDMALTLDGGFLIVGLSYDVASYDKTEDSHGIDYWIVRLDPSGVKLWDRSIGGNLHDYVNSVVALADGGFLLGGYSYSNISYNKSENNRGNSDYWIVRIDANGSVLWDKTYGGAGNDRLKKIILNPNGGFYLTGSSESNLGGEKSENSRGNEDFWILGIDANGNKLWDKTYGGTGQDQLRSAVTTQGNLYLAGVSTSNIGQEKSQSCRGDLDYWLLTLANSTSCAPPTNLHVVSVTNTSIMLRWNVVPGATSYVVEWWPLNHIQAGVQVVTGGQNAQYLMSGLTPNTTYQIRVKTRCGGRDSPYSLFLVTTTGSNCAPPSQVSAVPRPHGETILWDDVPGASLYTISWRKNVLGATWTTTNLPAPRDSFYISGLAVNTAYLFQIRARCGSNTSTWVSGSFQTPLTWRLAGDPAQTLETNIYPNPSDGRFTVQFDAQTAEPVTLTLTDLTGRTVYETHLAPQVGLNETSVETDVANGVYVLRLQQGATFMQAKIVIN